jgi:hypothetical protein
MSSTGKTQNYQLNQWVSSDKPMMDDFNADNQKVEAALSQLNVSFNEERQATGAALNQLNTNKASLSQPGATNWDSGNIASAPGKIVFPNGFMIQFGTTLSEGAAVTGYTFPARYSSPPEVFVCSSDPTPLLIGTSNRTETSFYIVKSENRDIWVQWVSFGFA